jgi:hypothetical protein
MTTTTAAAATTPTAATTAPDPAAVARTWLADFQDALSRAALDPATGDATDAVTDLFTADGWWKDRLISRWDYTTVRNRAAIAELLTDNPAALSLRDLTLDPTYPPVATPGWIQAIVTFRHDRGTGSGVVRLVETADGWRAWTF